MSTAPSVEVAESVLRMLRESGEYQAHGIAVVAAASGVWSESKRRVIVATGSLSPGTVIIRSPPLCVVLEEKEKAHRCAYCLKLQQSGLKRCSRCKAIFYCSQRYFCSFFLSFFLAFFMI